MPKDSNVGQTALIFTHEGLIARAKIRVKPEPGSDFGGRPVWGGKVGDFELLKPPILMNKLIKAMPEDWLWHKHPRRSFCTPSKEHADTLEALVDQALGNQNGSAAPEIQPQEDDDDETSSNGGSGYEEDPAIRKAVELHAMKLAEKHYRDNGFTVDDVSEKKLGYDIRCTGKGREVHVEVKGTRGDGSKVELTIGEVKHTRGMKWRSDLFVVSEIKVTGKNGEIKTSGGKCHIATAWNPADEDLAVTRYQYSIPPGLLEDVTAKGPTTKNATPKSKAGPASTRPAHRR
jgi:hypothetical protein